MARRYDKGAKAWEGDGVILSRKRSRTKRQRKDRSTFNFEWEDESTLAPYLDAVFIIQNVLDAILVHHNRTIKEGVHPGGLGPQKPLQKDSAQWRRARDGKRPAIRGWTGRNDGRAFPDALKRTKIRAGRKVVRIGNRKEGMSATGTIQPGLSKHKQWLQNELRHEGVQYFSVDGAVDRLIGEVMKQIIAACIVGPPPEEATVRERLAHEVRKVRSRFRPKIRV